MDCQRTNIFSLTVFCSCFNLVYHYNVFSIVHWGSVLLEINIELNTLGTRKLRVLFNTTELLNVANWRIWSDLQQLKTSLLARDSSSTSMLNTSWAWVFLCPYRLQIRHMQTYSAGVRTQPILIERQMLIKCGRREVRVQRGGVVSRRRLGPAVLNRQQPGWWITPALSWVNRHRYPSPFNNASACIVIEMSPKMKSNMRLSHLIWEAARLPQ